jgi:hypothetical protein
MNKLTLSGLLFIITGVVLYFLCLPLLQLGGHTFVKYFVMFEAMLWASIGFVALGLLFTIPRIFKWINHRLSRCLLISFCLSGTGAILLFAIPLFIPGNLSWRSDFYYLYFFPATIGCILFFIGVVFILAMAMAWAALQLNKK